MPQTYSKILVHVVFSTENRRPCLGPDIRPSLFCQIRNLVARSWGFPVAINGVEDHVHLLIDLKTTSKPCDAVRDIKARSSGWLKRQSIEFQQFSWQQGYFLFSVSSSQQDRLIRYIENQEEHHRHRGYKSELQALLARHQIANPKETCANQRSQAPPPTPNYLEPRQGR